MATPYAVLRNWFQGVFNALRGAQRSEFAGRSSESGVTVTDQRAIEVATVFGAIRILAETVGSTSLAVYERTPDGRQNADKHPLAGLLDSPNALMSGQQFIEALVAQLAGWGNAYVLIETNAAGKPVFLWPLPPENMQVIRRDLETLVYRYTVEGKVQDYTQEQILHIRGFGLDGVMGLSPLGVARHTLGVAIGAEQYSAQFFRSGGRPSGVLQVDKPLTQKQRDDLAQNYGPKFTGGDGGNALWILDSFAKYQPISISPEDSQLLLTRQFSVEEIARIFRVPLFLLMHGSKDSNWGTGLEQQDLAFLKYGLRPYFKRIEEGLSRGLLGTDAGQFYVEFNIESLLRADSKARADFYASALDHGWMNRNEVRAKENMAPFDGGDIYTARSDLLPVNKIGTQQAGPVVAPPSPPAN